MQAVGRSVGVDVREVVVRDMVVPVEVRRAAVAALTAQLEGRATVERARAETAALRSLANAGRVLADNPGLLQLRTVQEAAAGAASVVVAPRHGVGSDGRRLRRGPRRGRQRSSAEAPPSGPSRHDGTPRRDRSATTAPCVG